MTTIEERPSIAERYSSAIESSDLGIGERRKDVDIIIAAGLVPDSLAAALYRLHAEYDAVRGEHRAAEARMRQQEAAAKAQPRTEAGARKTKQIMAEADRQALTAHALILAQLTSLRDTKDRFARFAMAEASRHRFDAETRDILMVAGRVLSFMLDDTCRQCGGTGTVGGYSGGPVSICGGRHGCGGSKRREFDGGKTADERSFARHLLVEAERMKSEVAPLFRPRLRAVDRVKELLTQAAVNP